CALARVVEQGRFTDAGLATENQGTASRRARGFQQCPDLGALGIAPVQHSRIVRRQPGLAGQAIAEKRVRARVLNCKVERSYPSGLATAAARHATAEPRSHLGDLADSMQAVSWGNWLRDIWTSTRRRTCGIGRRPWRFRGAVDA